MRRIIALASLAVFFYLIATNLSLDTWESNLMDIEERDSIAFVRKSVREDRGEVVFGETENAETGSANMVSAIVVDYRSFDTLGEITVLFVSSLGVAFLLGGLKKRVRFKHQAGFVMKKGSDLVFGFILIFGVYMFIHGHLAPGGGFPGGAIIAAAFLLKFLADDKYKADMGAFKILEGTAGTLYVLTGGAGLLLGGYFLQNFLPSGTVGELFSSGIMPLVYIIVGLKVGCELTGIFNYFMKEEAGV